MNYDEDIFSKSIFCLAFGSDFFEKNPREIGRLLKWDLNDSDLGQIFDTLKYADLTEQYIELVFEYIDYSKFISDWDISCTSALNTISYYIYHFSKEEIFFRLRNGFLEFVKSIVLDNLDDDQRSFIKFYYKALLCSKYGKESHTMLFKIKDVLDSELFNI